MVCNVLKAKTDGELIKLFVETNNDKAFSVLLSKHKNKIFTVILMLVKDEFVANDLFQEVFIKIIDTLRSGKYIDDGKFIQWACRIARNTCLDYFRKQSKSKTHSFDAGTNTTLGFETTEINLFFDDEDAENSQFCAKKLMSLIKQLPYEQREVLILRFYANLSFKDIATLTNVSINTALGRLRYAVLALKKATLELSLQN